MAAPTAPAIGSPPELPTTSPPVYGLLSVPDGGLDEGPPDGLTLDEAIARLIRDNLDLRARFLEIPQARADVLTASLRSNPVLYADGQLIPYGQYSPQRPGGPVQYDLNITWPLDVSHKRRARTEVAERALRVLEAQYQDAVRLSIDNLHTAFVDVLAARQTVWYARASVEGLDRILEVTEALKAQGERSAADVNRVRILRNAAQIGLVDAEATLRGTQRILATLLNFPPPHAASLDVRGTLRDLVPPPPPLDVLNQIALGQRPDLIAFRLGIARAEADVRLAEANRLSDVFLLYQPFTYQDNSPFNAQSATSWALGVTVPLPLFNRNQGNIQRAVINVAQTRLELEALEHQVLTEVEQALREYEVSRSAVARIETDLLPTARQVRNDTFQLFTGGGAPVMDYLNAQRDYNELVRQYRDTLARHRRSMLSLNTALGLRLLP
jgi:cobalt-zinc-cadmium efflux system outer membrane protein